MNKQVFLFPGQGSQYVGMGKELHDSYSKVRELFDLAADTLKVDLKSLCFEGPMETLTQTDNVQPAVTLIDIICFEVLREEGMAPSAVAGHSLGEYSALYAAGVISFEDTLRLVKHRGACMQEAAESNPGGMAAIIGLDIEKVSMLCEEVAATGSVEVANHNSSSQIIVSGEKEALEKVGRLAKEAKAKLIVPLKVSGPWHSKFMTEAQSKMGEFIEGIQFQEASVPVIANVTADYESQPERITANLVNQITSPVLWLNSIERLLGDGYMTYVEVGPKRVLSGIMKNISKDVEMFNVENPETLKATLDSLSNSN